MSSSWELRARRGIRIQVAEDVLNCREQMLGPPRIGIEDVRVAERREVGAALSVGLDPGEAVVLIRPRALGAQPVSSRAIRLLDIDAQENVLFLARMRRVERELVELVGVLEASVAPADRTRW